MKKNQMSTRKLEKRSTVKKRQIRSKDSSIPSPSPGKRKDELNKQNLM